MEDFIWEPHTLKHSILSDDPHVFLEKNVSFTAKCGWGHVLEEQTEMNTWNYYFIAFWMSKTADLKFQLLLWFFKGVKMHKTRQHRLDHFIIQT